MLPSRRSLFVVAISTIAALASHAQTADHAPQWRVYGSGGRSMQNWHGQAALESLNIERSKQFKHGEYGLMLSSHVISQPRSWFGDGHENVPAAGLSLLARHRFKDDSHAAQPFIEVSSGPMWATERVPAATSHFNFLSQLGVGYVFHPERKMAWVVGWRFGHISNAGYGRLNSGLNINSLMIGTQFR